MKKTLILALAGGLVSQAAVAHDRWILPSHFTVSAEQGKGVWITSDVTASNQVFQYDKPYGSEDIEIITPQGKKQSPSSSYKGSRKSVFDYQLTADGTYKFQKRTTPRYYASYKVKGQEKPVFSRVDKAATKAKMPKDGYDLVGVMSFSRVESYVTLNKPNDKALAATGQHLELLPMTHPADIVEQDIAEFKITYQGKPVSNAEVSVVKEGTVYRNQLNATKLVSNGEGLVSFTPESAGRYLLHVEYEQDIDGNPLADKVNNEIFLTFEAGLE
ncbi:DUF4198 domain-containing protein [Shewanella waksmanii]|uniref:DUF4198 domain-containing protein n=1 Tax=Shewanella waksmanii TaxID=213783 RepID=UPI003734F4A5